IAHDLRGPFSGFLGLTEILAANLDGMEKEEIETCGKVMHSTAKKIFQLLTNLLDWSRLQSDKIELKPMDLNVCAEVENIISLYSTAAENKSILLENNCDKQMWIKSDQNMFSTILRNLISNAVKFTGTGGRISMESKVKNNFVEISVTDSGVGMTQEAMDKVFRIDSGYTTLGTNNEEGTGLGLVLCKELIEKNGGQISVESVPDKGTTFNVKLPAVKMKTEKLMNDTIDS
ncbi:MAG: sensor histidine kinase, partial [Methanococcaceae archaeon]